MVMTKLDQVEFARIMMALSEVFDGGREPNALKIELYFQALKEFRIEDISGAATAMIRGRVYPSFPKPAEIIQEINGTGEDRSMFAWILVVGAIRRHGSYSSVKFDDPAIHSVIGVMGGWPMLCQTEEDELKWRQKEFDGLYQVLAKQDGDHPDHLPGIVELENRINGYDDHIPEPIMVTGCERRLKLVHTT